ncbi:MAG: serine/threonine protein kinase, partial [Elusimicrobia bacterium]|nr:serine/threonine protein kinase [Elusimicrobiota bacterium]
MRRWVWVAGGVAVLCLAAAVPGGADELTEDRKSIRKAKNLSVDDLRTFLDKGDSSDQLNVPSNQVEQTTNNLMEQLRRRSKDLLAPMERLDTLRGGYPSLADLSAIDVERNELRRVLLEGKSEFDEQLQIFNSLKKMQQTADLQALLTGGMTGNTKAKIGNAIGLAYFGEEMRNFRLKLRSILAEEEEAYAARQQAIADEIARRKSLQRAGIAAAAGCLLLGGAVFGLLRRRRGAAASGPVGPGSVVGKNYRLDRELGRGGMGLVFEATDQALQRKVAIKQLRAELRQNEKDLKMFLDEARMVAGLKHPNIVEIYAIVNEGTDFLLVFELVTGQPLHLALQRVGRIGLNQATALLKQVGSALDFAHANKVIHRDLKPANIMITPQGAAKVMDFGLAHQASQTVARLTRAESWGTPPYMAPE